MTEERLAEIKHNYENACGVAYERWDYSQGYPPGKMFDFDATEDMLELITEVERLGGAEITLRKALKKILGITAHEDNVALFGDMAEIERIAKEALQNGD